MEYDIRYMKEALRLARKAKALGETPIGCVIVYDGPDKGEDKIDPAPERGQIIGRGYNRRNTDHSTLSHAEMTAIRKASRILGDWRLEDCTMYVTLEPCQMCAGAIVQARIPRVVIGAMSEKSGCAGSVYNLLEEPRFNHQAVVVRGVLREECAGVLKSFFTELRQKKTGTDRLSL
ncbi:MAG: nucleoside deaminase [Lachnospiraceae bacterium]|nr:nucleoside deaminase [Lachnospiraceae bacterium]